MGLKIGFQTSKNQIGMRKFSDSTIEKTSRTLGDINDSEALNTSRLTRLQSADQPQHVLDAPLAAQFGPVPNFDRPVQKGKPLQHLQRNLRAVHAAPSLVELLVAFACSRFVASALRSRSTKCEPVMCVTSNISMSELTY